MARALIAAALTLPLAGCGLIDKIREIKAEVAGVTESFVAGAFYLGSVPPEDPNLAEALAQTDVGSGGKVTAFLADASDPGQMDNAPIQGAGIDFVSTANGRLHMREVNPGEYQVTGDDGLAYVSGEVVRLDTDYGGEDREVRIIAPASPTYTVEKMHAAGQGIEIDISGQGFGGALVMIIGVPSGEVLFSNLPEGGGEFYDLTHGGGDTAVSVPGGLFEIDQVYAIGVAGTVVSEDGDLTGVNTALSSMLAARFRFSTVCTFADADVCDNPPSPGDTGWPDSGLPSDSGL